MAADVVLSYPKAPGGPVDVPPAKPEEFALSKPCHGGGHIQGPIRGTESMLGGNCPQQRLDFVDGEEADVRVLFDFGPFHSATRVGFAPAFAPAELEYLMEQRHSVSGRLGS